LSVSVLCQGQHLKRGSRLVDFNISLGDAVCGPVSLTDDQVQCRPPPNSPNNNDTSCHRNTLSINVCIHVTYYETSLQITLWVKCWMMVYLTC